jgi:hypothetical protein
MLAHKSVSKRTLIVVLSVCFVAAGTLAVFAKWLVSGQFGKVSIRLRNGSNVYVVREARGLSSEQLSVTRNSDGCTSADPAKDYIYENPDRTELLYSITAEGLTIYDDPFNVYIKEPANPWADIKVSMSRSKNPYYRDVRANPEKYGATLIEIPLNETCWWNLFRRSSGNTAKGKQHLGSSTIPSPLESTNPH